MLKKVFLGATAALLLSAGVSLADGLFPGLPIEGGASYCAGYSVFNTTNTVPGTTPTPNVCSVTVPAGVTAPTGTEYLPVDLYGLNQQGQSQGLPQTEGLAAAAMGFGLTVVSTTAGAATIANNTVNYVVDVSETAASALTLPAIPQPWQILRIAQVVANGGSGTTTLTANSNQTLVPSSITVAGNSVTGVVTLIWNPTAATWYRIG
jgi:hypothetical protein